MEKTPSAAAATAGRVALVCLLGAAALAQEPPTFRSDAQVVLLDVIARDNRGQPVADLREDEIQVFEDGQRCEIASFRLVRMPRASSPAADAAVPAPPGAPATVEADAPSRANLVVLVFDTIPVANAVIARQGALNLLSQRFPANTWFAVYKIDRSMRLVQPFTSDPSRLEAAVRAATTGDDARRGGPPPSLQTLSDAPPAALTTTDPTRPDAPPVPNLGAIGSRVDAYLGEIASRRLAFDSLYGLLALARGLEPVRGRKSILYFALASEFGDSVTYAYETTVGAANRAGVTIHTVDARGLSPMRVGGRSAFDEAIGSFSASGATAGASGPAAASRPATFDTSRGDPGGGPIYAAREARQPALGIGAGPHRPRHGRPRHRRHQRPRPRPLEGRRGAGPVLRGRLRAAAARVRRALPADRGEGLAQGRAPPHPRGLLRDARGRADARRLRAAAPRRARRELRAARLLPPGGRPPLRLGRTRPRRPLPGRGGRSRA